MNERAEAVGRIQMLSTIQQWMREHGFEPPVEFKLDNMLYAIHIQSYKAGFNQSEELRREQLMADSPQSPG